MKLKRVKIENFKVFKEKIIDFEAADIAVLDGPNGFGKTSVYDALELVFTGTIRRYQKMVDEQLDGRMTYLENPLYHEGNAGGDLIITVEFIKEETSYVIGRAARREAIHPNINFSIFQLFTKPSFEAEQRITIADESSYLVERFGVNYAANFRFLNYVEQEESTFILKHKDRDRKRHISHLFDLNHFEEQMKRIEEIRKKMAAQSDNFERQANSLQTEIQAIRLRLADSAEPVSYTPLFPDTPFDWDRQQPDGSVDELYAIIDDLGPLSRMRLLVERKAIFKQYRFNAGVSYLQTNLADVRAFVRFYHFRETRDALATLQSEQQQVQQLANQLQQLTLANIHQDINPLPFGFIPSELIEEFFAGKLNLTGRREELGSIERTNSEINDYRQQLTARIEQLRTLGVETQSCVLCGYDWGNIDTLLRQIGTKSASLQSFNNDAVVRLDEAFAAFKNIVVEKILSVIGDYFQQAAFSPSFLGDFLAIQSSTRFDGVTRTLQFLDIPFEPYLSTAPERDDIDGLLGALLEHVAGLSKDVPADQIASYFQEFFQRYFRNNFDLLERLTLEQINQKIAYIKRFLIEKQSEQLVQREEQLRLNDIDLQHSKAIVTKLRALHSTYKQSLQDYQRKIIQDIEIVFHIYSGRIMQSFQGGLGMFIFAEKDGIRFQSDSTKTYDAIFSMSSGQLAALVMSFTLALHKIYSQNDIILIDDPVQSMDELNLYGFIELLRNEFSTSQVILSTHEDMMSAFMRYKFGNFNLTETSINLKDTAST